MANDEIILKERLHNYLDTYIKNTKLIAPKFYITNGSNKGDNYVSLVYRVMIESRENDEIKKRWFIIKTTQLINLSGKSLEFTDMFQREVFFYQEILPIFKESLKEHGIIERFPIFYDANNEIGKEALADEDKHYVERLQRFSNKMKDNMCSVVDGTLAEPYAVLNHGDAWTNNILFKYDQDGNTPSDLRFIDFQLCRYASPVLDLVYVLFCCCTQETRSKYYDQLIHEYYETLSKYIKRCGYNSDILFPYEALLQQFSKFGKYAAGMALYVLHLFNIEGDEINLMSDISILEDRLQTDSFYKSMVKGTFKDLIDRNYI